MVQEYTLACRVLLVPTQDNQINPLLPSSVIALLTSHKGILIGTSLIHGMTVGPETTLNNLLAVSATFNQCLRSALARYCNETLL